MHQITEEQRKRSELNRLAALAKRRNRDGSDHDPWKLFKCRKVSPEPNSSCSFTEPFKSPPRPDLSGQISKVPAQLADKFRVRVEICSPDSFSVTPVPLDDFPFPGEAACLEIIEDCLSTIMQSHYTQNTGGGKACVYKLREYDAVLRCFKMSKRFQCQEVPWSTLNVVVKLSDSFTSGRWVPCRPEHLSDEKVDELLGRLPKSLVDTLLPFQHEGVRFGLRRGGRCLIADEMGLGKTLQAIAIAGCFLNEGPVLVVCPAILRYAWAEEFEHWLPNCLPCDIHLVFGHQNNPARLVKCPKVVITSYTMLSRLRKSMSQQDWAVLIVDESHHVRCSKQISESDEIKAVLDVAKSAKHTVLLSGTPSLSRPYDIFHQIDMLWPGLLGKDKYEFAKNYCSVKSVHGFQGKVYKDYSRGVRLEELNVLLKQSVMIRRLKKDVLMQLPPKRRQIISLVLKKSDFNFARGVAEVVEDASTNKNTEDESLGDIADEPNIAKSAGGVAEVVEDASTNKNIEDESLDIADESNNAKSAGDADWCKFSIKITDQELAMAKLSGFREWLSIHPVIAELNADEDTERNSSSHKMIIFAHHHKVLDAVQEFICEKGTEFVRIDGNTHERDRQLYVQSFQSSKQVKIALVGILAGGTGLNLSAAHNVAFLELPKEPSHLLQAEDRAHRRGQTKAVNIYIFCAKDSSDESRWQKLNKSLHRVSSTVNGKYDAIQEIEIDSVAHLGATGKTHIKVPPIASATEHSAVDLMEFPTSIDQNLRCDQASGAVDENKRYDEENYSGRNSSQKAANFHLNEGSKGIPETEKEICTGLSIHSEIDVKEDNDITDRANNQFHEIAMQDNKEPAEIVEAASVIDSLRFEVSQYSGRIHLYTCNPGVDSRPRPLFENFRPEELESQHPSANCSQRMTYSFIKDDPKYRHILLEFIEEWNKLRPIEQKKLLAKPLQLPLSVELCCVNNSINHDFGGLLKGKSKKRTTSLHEISYPLPSDAVWRKISLCSGRGKKEKVYEQGWTLSDEPLCKLCQTPCKGKNAKVPEYFEDLFCNLNCYEEFRLRTSNRSLREGLFQMEHGICTSCHLDCHKLVEHAKRLPLEKRESYIKKVAPDLANRPKFVPTDKSKPVMMSVDDSGGGSVILKFATLQSCVDEGFWHSLSALKLDHLRVDESPVSIRGFYAPSRSHVSIPLSVVAESLPPEPNALPPLRNGDKNKCCIPGTLYNTNTIESFNGKEFRRSLFRAEAEKIWKDIHSGRAEQDSSLLSKFHLITFADLKNYKFYYSFAFPALVLDPPATISSLKPASQYFSPKEAESLTAACNEWRNSSSTTGVPFFLVSIDSNSHASIKHLNDWEVCNSDGHECLFGFYDPCHLPNTPGWPLRNFIAFICSRWNHHKIRFFCYREHRGFADLGVSLVGEALISVSQEWKHQKLIPNAIGWEVYKKGKIYECTNLANSMDSTLLAVTAAELNLKLMKWRALPSLDLNKLSATKCLLLGAGSLGCHVARMLMAWGVRKITLVDHGKVSMSNPLQQSLYTSDDCGECKALAAVKRLAEIFPAVEADGVVMSIPMPGHSVSIQDEHDGVREGYERLQNLIDSHDAVFLLTDTRESRWLPTLLCSHANKITITAALGFDNFLVMRHGTGPLGDYSTESMSALSAEMENSSLADRDKRPRLGCYFCSDVVASIDSTSNRQQCTFKRPGLAPIASALAVELLVGILHHPHRIYAKAESDDTMDSGSIVQPLGILPHQIEGSLFQASQKIPASDSSSCCTACCCTVVTEFHNRRMDFVLQAINHPTYLEDIIGLTELEKAANKPYNLALETSLMIANDRLAVSAAELSLKLMRQRAFPSLDLNTLSATKCLLLGAGTLGCQVARMLMDWGVRKITLVDSGKVSMSNPLRQSLYTLEHSLEGGKYKAHAAVERLKEILPTVEADGVVMSIPMPGHPVPRNNEHKVLEDCKRLQDLIDSHDAVFLLTDTRESRWLPTLLCSNANKITITAALGFDCFLVMRHGAGPLSNSRAHLMGDLSAEVGNSSFADERPRLGCYFCSDIVAPIDSTSNRTLDQQCTVTRPALAPIASALAVELLVGILHHPHRIFAKAENANSMDSGSIKQPLGILPHQIRGSLSHFSQMTLSGLASSRCTACCCTVVTEFHNRKMDFVLQAINHPTYLEDLTGITELLSTASSIKLDWDNDTDDDNECVEI